MNPNIPITEMQAVAVQMHEMFTAYVDAGFTEEQAMRILLRFIANGANTQEN